MEPLQYIKLWLAVGYLLISATIVLSLVPPPTVLPLGGVFLDKILHIACYGLLMLWFAQIYPARDYWLLAIGFIFLGIVDMEDVGKENRVVFFSIVGFEQVSRDSVKALEEGTFPEKLFGDFDGRRPIEQSGFRLFILL